MQREDASVLSVPALVPSGPDSDSDDSDSDDDDADFLGSTRPLIFPHLSPYSSPKKATSERKYCIPAQLAPAAHDDDDDRERRRLDALPLTALNVRPHITTVALAPTTCVSCGLGPDTAPESAAFVVLDR